MLSLYITCLHVHDVLAMSLTGPQNQKNDLYYVVSQINEKSHKKLMRLELNCTYVFTSSNYTKQTEKGEHDV